MTVPPATNLQTGYPAVAALPAGERWDPETAAHTRYLLSEINKLRAQKDKAEQDAKHWSEYSQNTIGQHSALTTAKADLEQKVKTLERQLKEEQSSNLTLKRRVSIR